MRPLSYTSLEKFHLCPQRYNLHYNHELAGIPESVRAQDKRYTLDLAEQIVDRYTSDHEHWSDYYEAVAVEEFRELDIEGIPFITKPYLVYCKDSAIYVRDFKTTKWYKPLLPYDFQQLGQALAYDAQYIERYSILLKFGPKGKTEFSFKSDLHRVTHEQLEHWKWDLIESARQLDHVSSTRDPDWFPGVGPQWPRRTSSCHAFGRPCPFIPLCSGTAELKKWPKRTQISSESEVVHAGVHPVATSLTEEEK
jgi:hypothetical protein